VSTYIEITEHSKNNFYLFFATLQGPLTFYYLLIERRSLSSQKQTMSHCLAAFSASQIINCYIFCLLWLGLVSVTECKGWSTQTVIPRKNWPWPRIYFVSFERTL